MSPYSHLGETADGKILLRAKGVGSFLVYGGRTIEYHVAPDAELKAVDAFLWARHVAPSSISAANCLFTPVLSSGLMERAQSASVDLPALASRPPLLPSSFWDGGCSPMIRHALHRMAISATVWPGPAQIKLRPDACRALSIDTLGLPFEGGEEGKFLLPVDRAHDAARLTAIVELGGADAAPRLEPLTGAAAMAVLSRHVVGRRKMRALPRPSSTSDLWA